MRKPIGLSPLLLSHVLETGHEHYFVAGSIVKEIASLPPPLLYVKKGAIRLFTTLEVACETTYWIATEGELIGMENIFDATGHYLQIEIIEDADLIVIPGRILADPQDQISSELMFFRLGWIEYRMRALKMNYEIVCKKGALDRYRLFQANFPDYCTRFPLKYIASWLQMDQATLSRVRAKRI
jgi:CRP-like cAMP-binding protein